MQSEKSTVYYVTPTYIHNQVTFQLFHQLSSGKIALYLSVYLRRFSSAAEILKCVSVAQFSYEGVFCKVWHTILPLDGISDSVQASVLSYSVFLGLCTLFNLPSTKSRKPLL